MNSLIEELHATDIATGKVSDYRVALTSMTKDGHFGEHARLTVSKHDTLDNVMEEIKDFALVLRDSDNAIYGLVIEDLAPDTDEDGFSHPVQVHRLRISRQQAIGMAA